MSDRITRLQAINSECQTIVRNAESENRDLTDSEAASVDALLDEGAQLRRQHELTGRADTLDQLLSAATPRLSEPDPIAGDDGHGLSGGQAGFTFQTGNGETIRALTPKQKIHKPRQETEISVGNFLRTAITGNTDLLHDQERRAYMAATGSGDTSGGYLLPGPLSTRFVDLARSASVCIQAGAQTLPMSDHELAIARLSGDPTASWRGETVAVTASSPTFDRVTLRPKVCAALVPISVELAEDSFNAGQIIESAISSALGLKLDQACLAGTGASAEPLGVRNHADVNTIASVGTPSDYSDVTAAIGDILGANYSGDVSELAWIRHPRDAETYDALADTTGQPMMPTPWAGAIRKLFTTSVATTEGGGSNESYMVFGRFSEMLIGMRTSGVTVQILDSGSVTEGSDTWNATSQMMRFIRAYIRVDVALLRPTWFTVSTGVTA